MGLLVFCLRSLFRAYGWRFLWRVAAPRPLRFGRALAGVRRLKTEGDTLEVPAGGDAAPDGPLSLVGVGFCLKPEGCPSGRFSHGCLRLEAGSAATACCDACEVRAAGEAALSAGAAFVIMTSARDILEQLFRPALEEGRYTSGLFLLCRYSFLPFAVGLLASGMRARLLAFAEGDCRDYRTWVSADVGVKKERTTVSAPVLRLLLSVGGACSSQPVRAVLRDGVLHPARTGAPPPSRTHRARRSRATLERSKMKHDRYLSSG